MTVSADSLRLGIVEEATESVTPATPAFNLLRITGESLAANVNTTTSDEMGGLNRGVKDNILTGAETSGSLNFELSKHFGFEELLASGLGNAWAEDPLGVPGSDADDVYDAQSIRTWTIEKRFTVDDTPTYSYHRYVGCMVDTVSISITPNEPITGAFGIIGTDAAIAATEIAGSTYTPAEQTPVMTAPLVTGIELLSPAGISDVDGTPTGTPVTWLANSCFTGLDINIANNGRGLQCIGVLGNKETVLGRFECNASGTLYYGEDEPLEALRSQEEYALRVTTTDDDGESFEFLFPRVSFATATALASGTNTDVMTEFTMQCLEYQGDTYATTLIITRSSAGTMAASTTPVASTSELGATTDEET